MRSMKSFFVLSITFLMSSIASADDEYIFILRARGNPYWRSVANGISETAQERSIQAVIYQGESDKDSEEQLNTCLTAIERKPKLIVMSAATVSVGLQCLKKASEKGILVAEMDSTIPLEEASRAGILLAYSVGSDNTLIGQEAAKYANSLLQQISNPKIVILEGALGSAPGKQRVDGFHDELVRLNPRVTFIASSTADWDRLKAMNIITDILQRSLPDLIYAANDLMALGAVEALRTNKKGSHIAVLGVDGTLDAQKAILRGQMAGTVAQLPYLLGKRALEMGVEVVKGNNFLKREVVQTPILTKEILQQKTASFFTYVR